MIRFTNIFIKSGKVRRSERIALATSVLLSFVFLMWFALRDEPLKPPPQILITSDPSHAPDIIPQIVEPPDRNKNFRVVPVNFTDIDFSHWSYGLYRFGEKKFILGLSQGQREYPAEEGGGGEIFSLDDVFYTDITGDGKKEAIVMLSHVQCGGSCDGGSDLIYIYENRKGGTPRKIWEYETGSMAYGCGLKSFTVSNKKLALEMFGHCWQAASSFEGSAKFFIRDLTRTVFHYNGRRFVKASTQITAAPPTDLRNYIREVHIEN